MPRFNDSEARRFEPQPEGDYILRVVEFDVGLSKGGKTAGADQYEVEFEIEGKSGRVWENLIDHEATAWKLDLFVKAAGVAPPKGAAYEFTADRAARAGVAFVDPFGLRVWARLVVDEYNGKKRNKVSIFYTDKPKLEPVRPAKSAEAPAVTPGDEDDIPF